MTAMTAKKTAGFTLIELLIAMALTVLIGTLAWRFLDGAMRVGEQGEQTLARLNDVERVWALVSADVTHVQELLPELSATDNSVAWLRHGWINPLQQSRSALQQVQYRLIDGQLWREYRAERNLGDAQSPAARMLLMSEVEHWQLRFLPPGGHPQQGPWLDTWPVQSAGSVSRQVTSPGIDDGQPAVLPIAVEVQLRTAWLGEVRRIFVLPGV
jgi:general secretion pathway protein J